MRRFGWFGRRGQTADLDDEIAAHLEMATRDRMERGAAAEDAHADAMREFGNVALIQQTTREMSSWTSLEQLLQDLRFGARILWTAPGVSATAIILIALVIGGNTTIYSMVNSLIVSPAPGVTAQRLVVVRHVEAGVLLNDPFVSFPTYEDYAARATAIEGLVGWSDERLTLRTETGNYAVRGGLVTPNYFETLGVTIAHGRGFRVDDDHAAEAVVAVISDRLWRERFGGAADVVGRVAVVNNIPVTIIGVTVPGFMGSLRTPDEDLWVPIRAYYRAIGNRDILSNRAQPTVLIAGRLAGSASLSSARAEFAGLLKQLQLAYPETFMTYAPQGGLVRLKEPHVHVSRYSANALLPAADILPRFLALFTTVTLITLLIVSANVANLLLGRAVERQRDTAVRQSLGASRWRILRTQLAEGMTLSLTAMVAACIAAWWMTRVLFRIIEPRPGFLSDARPDWTFLAYALALALVATFAFSIGPAVRAWRVQVLPVLKSGEQSVARGRSRLSSALVVLQFAFSVVLITAATLAYRSLAVVTSGDVGFDTNRLLLMTVRASVDPLVGSTLTDADRASAFARLEHIREQLAVTGNVESVTYMRRVPGDYFNAATAVWRAQGDARASVYLRVVGPDYLRTLGLTPVAGRELTAVDHRGATRMAVINTTLARELFPDTSPIGQTVLVGALRNPVQVVGVVPSVMYDGPVHKQHPLYLLVAEQQLPGDPSTEPTFVVRYQGTLDAVSPLVSRALAEVDSSMPIVSLTTMNQRLSNIAVMEKTLLQLASYFAIVSLVIAALGQYAVAMFGMRRRRRDFGVRLALGASARQIEGEVVREALSQCVKGILIGFVLSAGTAFAAGDLLTGVAPIDPFTYAFVFLLLALASTVASSVPAWQAGRVNVMQALRQD